jgi:hypothetical protein
VRFEKVSGIWPKKKPDRCPPGFFHNNMLTVQPCTGRLTSNRFACSSPRRPLNFPENKKPRHSHPGLPAAGVLLGSLEGDAVPNQKGGQPLLAGASNSPWVAMFQTRRSPAHAQHRASGDPLKNSAAWLKGKPGNPPRSISTTALRGCSKKKGRRRAGLSDGLTATMPRS